MLKIVTRSIGIAALLLLLAFGALWGWLNFHTSDIPDVKAMALLAPIASQTVQQTICNQTLDITVVPSRDIASVLPVLFAAEGDFDSRGVLHRTVVDLANDHHDHRYGHYSLLISRQMNCGFTGRNLVRQMRELRTAIQLERQFSREQILTIYLNSGHFGPKLYGVENAAQSYFGKHVTQLTTAEAAVLAAVLRAPNYYSPTAHPDRATARRNEIINELAKRGVLTEEDASLARREPLRTVTIRNGQ